MLLTRPKTIKLINEQAVSSKAAVWSLWQTLVWLWIHTTLVFRRHFREVLKQQMMDRDQNKKTQMQEKIKETERALAYDRECRMNDANEYFRKHNYLMQFRDGNKNVSLSCFIKSFDY